MSRQLLILRHAKSAWDTDAPNDFDRPLNKRGKKDAPRIGAWLREQNLTPEYVLSSPAERAKQTVLKAARELGIRKKQIHWDPRIYDAGTSTLLEVLADCPANAKTVLLVGHNPGLEFLVEYLCDNVDVPADGKLLPTAALARLDMPDVWDHLEPGAARLVAIIRPRSLET